MLLIFLSKQGLLDYRILLFFEVNCLHSKTGAKLKSHFARHSILDTLISDNNPCFNEQEFVETGRKYEFNQVTSTANHALSTKKSRNAVKIVKRVTMKCFLITATYT